MSGEKTEQPTDKRLRDAREQGDIAKSQEVVSAATVIAVVFFFIANADNIFKKLLSTTDYVFSNSITMPYDEALRLIGAAVIDCSIGIVLPIVAAVLCAALVALLSQTGFLFAPKGAIPKLENLSPAKWFKQVFSVKNLIEFIKNIIKVTVLSVAVYMAAKNSFREFFKIQNSNIGSVWELSAVLLKDLAIYAIVAFSILAAIDFVYTKFKYTKDHMMSPDEVKQEYKEMEGDPQIKSKRRQLHQEMANQSTLANTRKAKVLITNPTHYAVAIDYEEGRTKLPVILAKGQGDLARRMIAIAKEEHIPIMRQPPLARALFAEGSEEQYVPSDLLVQVAEVLCFIDKMRTN